MLGRRGLFIFATLVHALSYRRKARLVDAIGRRSLPVARAGSCRLSLVLLVYSTYVFLFLPGRPSRAVPGLDYLG